MDNWSLVDHIVSYISRPRMGSQKAPTLWPSEAAAMIKNEHGETVNVGRCRRSVFFRYLKHSFHYHEKYAHYESLIHTIDTYETEPENYLRFIWAQGNLYEDYILDNAKCAGVYVADQTPIYIPEFNVSGKMDVIVWDPIDRKNRIAEVKSVYGFGANNVLGTPAQRRHNKMGKPRDSYIMQLGLYQWWYANKRDDFGDGIILVGARDTGRYGEFGLTVELDANNENRIYYYQNNPYDGIKKDSGITIENILDQYVFIQLSLESNTIPKRDFDAQYSDERLEELYISKRLNKSEISRYERRKIQIERGATRVNKQIEKGDWQCNYCSFKNVCYKPSGEPRDLSI